MVKKASVNSELLEDMRKFDFVFDFKFLVFYK